MLQWARGPHGARVRTLDLPVPGSRPRSRSETPKPEGAPGVGRCGRVQKPGSAADRCPTSCCARMPGRAPSRRALALTRDSTPSRQVETPSPIRAVMASTVAAAIPRRSRIGRRATPASSIPIPASLNSASRASTCNVRSGWLATTPPCEPVSTIWPASAASTMDAESMQITRGRPGARRHLLGAPRDTGPARRATRERA